MYGLSLLENELLKHTLLKTEDKTAIRTVCEQLPLDDELHNINRQLKEQIELEATASYLMGKYTTMFNKIEFTTDHYRAIQKIKLGVKNHEGVKWTKQGKEDYLLVHDELYTSQLKKLNDIESLLVSLKEFSSIVYKRNAKLEQLSVNYRQEIRVDEKF